MKILKVFGIVAGIHLLALLLIFANPGCTSTTRPPPVAADTLVQSESPVITVPNTAPVPAGYDIVGESPIITFNPDAGAVPAGSSAAVRYNPTRPGSPAATTLIPEPVTDVTPATTYVVVAGDNLSKIAKKHHTTIADISAANKLKSGAVLRPGQKLLIPAKSLAGAPVASVAPPAVTPSARVFEPAAAKPSGDGLKHVVRTGESLSTIARQYGVRMGELAVVNNISDPQKIRAGMELIIPGWQAPPPEKSGRAVTQRPAAESTSKSLPPRAAVEPVSEPAKPPPPEVPVIRVDDNPLTPAPRS
jgi:LysM repeat protein